MLQIFAHSYQCPFTEVHKNYSTFPEWVFLWKSTLKGWMYCKLNGVINTGYITILIKFNFSKKNMAPYTQYSTQSCPWEWRLSCELYYIGCLHPQGIPFFSPAIIFTVFHISVLKWQPTAPVYASWLLKTFLNTRWSACLEILAISLQTLSLNSDKEGGLSTWTQYFSVTHKQ
jgi:hypothetical protein